MLNLQRWFILVAALAERPATTLDGSCETVCSVAPDNDPGNDECPIPKDRAA